MIASCLTVAAMLLAAKGGETIALKGDCPTITIAKTYPRPVTLDLTGATLRGIVVTGGGVRLRGGTVRAAGGAHAIGPAGYGVLLRGAHGVLLTGMTITAAKKGMVIDRSHDIEVVGVRFTALGEDGIIANASSGLTIRSNVFSGTIGKQSECEVAGKVTLAVAQRDCRGAWRDGYHADAIQLRDGITNALISRNVISGRMQGIGQMEGPGDAPLRRVRIEHNRIATDEYHRLTLYHCIDCTVRFNRVERARGSTKRAVIIPGTAAVCGNVVPDRPATGGPKCEAERLP